MSGIEVFGVVAGAVQLADTTISLVSEISRLCRQFRDYPHNLSKRQSSLEQLVQIAKIIRSTKLPDVEIIHDILEGSIADVRTLLDLIRPLTPKHGDSKTRRGWKAVCGITKENQILEALRHLDEYKGALLLCISVSNSKLLSTVDNNILNLCSKANNALREVPTIRRSLESISSRLQGLMLSKEATREQGPGAGDISTLATAVMLALPNTDNGSKETFSSEISKNKLRQELVRHLVQDTSEDTDMDTFDTDWPSSPRNPDECSVSGTSTATVQPTGYFLVSVSFNPLFTGRKSIISKMKEHYFKDDKSEQKRLVLTGLGGVGKTQIATSFAYEAYANGHYSTVLWVFSMDKHSLLKSLTQISKSLGLHPDIKFGEETELPVRIPSLALALLRWLSQEHASKWLLVFDNVDDLDSFDISSYFPKVPWGDILITSRRKQSARLGCQIVVDIMEEDEAVELLHRCSGISVLDDSGPIRHVAGALGYLPLALDQAGAYVSEQCIGFAEYIELYGESRERLLRHKPPKAVWSYEETVFTTWEMSFATVSNLDPLATKLLNMAAFFNSDNIPLGLVCNLSQHLKPDQRLLLKDFLDFVQTRSDYSQFAGRMCNELMASKLQVSQAIGRLASLSLVHQKSHRQRNVSIHPLVHFWLRERQVEEDRIALARAAICLVLHALINAYDLSQFADAEVIYPHLFVCLEHVYTTPKLLSDTELQKLGAYIITIDGWVPFSIDPGTLTKADRFYDYIANRQAETEWRIPEAMQMIRRALRLKSLGRRKETSEHCARYLKTFQQRNRFDKIYVACLARTSAPCFFRVGDHDGAEDVYSLVDDSLDSSGAMLARKQLVLGAIKIDRGLFLEAEALLESCASELLRGIGQEHFLVRVWHQLMATCYISQRRYEEAEATVLEQLEGRLQMLNTARGEFSFSDYELAEVYARILREQLRFEEGRIFLADVLRKTESNILRPARSLGELSMALVQLDEATHLFQKTNESDRNDERRRIDALIAHARLVYKDASAAYELEWNRGMWVFKHFNTTMEGYKQRLESHTPISNSVN